MLLWKAVAEGVESTEKLGEADKVGEGYIAAAHRAPFQDVPLLHSRRAVDNRVQPPKTVCVGHHWDALLTLRPPHIRALSKTVVYTAPGAQAAERIPTQARRWGLQMVFRAHRAAALGFPGIKEGDGKAEGVGAAE